MQCKICFKSGFSQLYYHVVRIHNISTKKYAEKYGKDSLISNELLEHYKKINTGKNNPRYGTHIKLSKEAIERRTKKIDVKKGKITKFTVFCHKCKNETDVFERSKEFPKKEKYFCSRSCANSRQIKFSIESRQKISKSIKKLWKNEEYVKKMINSNVRNNKIFSSKGERELQQYFINTFPDDEWTFGGAILFKNKILTRDLYSKKLKICIEYDGVWHFKDIHGQLENKQLKDKLLKEWCINNNYRLIRIKDSLYQSDKKYWLNKLIEEVYNNSGEFVLLYNTHPLKKE